jgi:hypothetical protein
MEHITCLGGFSSNLRTLKTFRERRDRSSDKDANKIQTGPDRLLIKSNDGKTRRLNSQDR